MVKTAFNNIAAEVSGLQCHDYHTQIKYKWKSKEYCFTAKGWREETKDVAVDGYLLKQLYIVPVINEKTACIDCGILDMLSLAQQKKVMKAKSNKDALLKAKMNKKAMAKKHKDADMERVRNMRVMAKQMGSRMKFMMNDDEGIFYTDYTLPCFWRADR